MLIYVSCDPRISIQRVYWEIKTGDPHVTESLPLALIRTATWRAITVLVINTEVDATQR